VRGKENGVFLKENDEVRGEGGGVKLVRERMKCVYVWKDAMDEVLGKGKQSSEIKREKCI